MIYKSSILELKSYSINIDLLRDLQNISRRRLHEMGYSVDNTTDEDALRLFFNAQKRLVSGKPRKILKSKEFLCPTGYEEALQEIEGKIKLGQSITSYMSKTILDPKYKDLLLFDWNIHHLHLSKRVGTDGFVKRSDYELFIFFTKDTAYFVQIYPHAKNNLYSTQEMIKIIHDNWPDIISRFKINGVLTQKVTDADYALLRKAGVSSFVEVDGEIIYGIMGGGYATDRSSIEVTRNADYWNQLMRNCQKIIVSEVNGIIGGIGRLLGRDANIHLEFELICLNDNEFTLYEKANNVCLQLYRDKTYYRLCLPADLFRDAEY